MDKITINTISVSHTNKEGQAFLDKNQRPFKRVAIKTEDGRNMSCVPVYEGNPILNWKSGEEREVIVTQNGKYINFDIPKKIEGNAGPAIAKTLENINQKLDEILAILESQNVTKATNLEGGINAKDLNF